MIAREDAGELTRHDGPNYPSEWTLRIGCGIADNEVLLVSREEKFRSIETKVRVMRQCGLP